MPIASQYLTNTQINFNVTKTCFAINKRVQQKRRGRSPGNKPASGQPINAR